MLQFNKVGVHEGIPVTLESFTSGDVMQHVQKGPYPDAILQVSDSSIPISFAFFFQTLLVLKSLY